MVSLFEVARSIYGAYRLARLDEGGLAYFDSSPAGALRSFWVAALVAPIFVFATAVGWSAADVPPPLFRTALVEGLFYVVGWCLFPFVMIYGSRLLDRTPRYPLFLSAYNWSHIIQIAIVLPPLFLGLTGLLPAEVITLLFLGAYVLTIAYEAYVIRTALDIGMGEAIGLALFDFVLALILEDFSVAVVLR